LTLKYDLLTLKMTSGAIENDYQTRRHISSPSRSHFSPDVIYTHNVICNYKLHTRVIELQITPNNCNLITNYNCNL